MRNVLLAILSIISSLFIATSPIDTNAQASDPIGREHIRSFDTQVFVGRDNSVRITEKIEYDFASLQRHGIYRDIPIDYTDGNDAYYLNFSLAGVWDGKGTRLQTELSTEQGNKRIRIGDPDRTVTGVYTYQIEYTLSPIITNKNDSPFLNLDVIGEGWEVPIYDVSAKIHLADDAQLSNVIWFGPDNKSVRPSEFGTTYVAPYQGVTINANLPQDYVSSYLQPNQRRTSDIIANIVQTIVASIVAAVVLFVIVIVAARTIRTHKRRKSQTVVPEYEPPADLLPAHIGLLQDDVAQTREVTATIIDWAVRGYIRIAYIPKKGFFGSKDYEIIKLKEPVGLSEPEVALFNSLLGDATQVKLSELDKKAVPTQVTSFKTTLKSQLTDKGYYDKEGVIFMRGTLTEQGAKQWAKVDGFRWYLNTVEKDRLAFSDAPEKTPERFNACLPYAIALGVEKQWAKQFKDINLAESTTWYSGNLAAFSAVSLASDLGGSFASAVSTNSSVSSSGGSSGGGFGGGGGGSW